MEWPIPPYARLPERRFQQRRDIWLVEQKAENTGAQLRMALMITIEQLDSLSAISCSMLHPNGSTLQIHPLQPETSG